MRLYETLGDWLRVEEVDGLCSGNDLELFGSHTSNIGLWKNLDTNELFLAETFKVVVAPDGTKFIKKDCLIARVTEAN